MQEFGLVCTLRKKVPNLHSADGWKTVKSKFLTYFNPIGSTKEKHGKR